MDTARGLRHVGAVAGPSSTTPSVTRTDIDDDLLSADETASEDALDGKTIDRYFIVGKLGEGGMGTVYSAYDPELDRRIALKILHAQPHRHSRQTQARTRLAREAQAIAKVSHPNVVVVYDVGVVEIDGEQQVYIAMELIDGCDLRTWMQRLHETAEFKSGQAWRRIVDVMVQAGRGLAAAHAVGVMHRDFKPDNVLVGDDGIVRVVDFGLARRLGDGPERDAPRPPTAKAEAILDERITVTGAVLGTPAYMAPEQFRGESTDARTDQFAFCLTLHEALYGVRAFASDTSQGLAVAVMEGKRRPAPAEPPVPEHLLAIVDRGLAREPEDRFASMADVLQRLEDDPVLRRRLRRNRVVAVGLAGGAVAGALWLGAQREPTVALSGEDPCAEGAARVETVYGAAQRGAVRDGLASIDRPFAPRVAEATVTALDGYADDWRAGARDACEATHVRHEQTGAMLDKRVACLDRRLTALRMSVDALVGLEASELVHAVEVAEGLPPVEACANREALQAAVPPPEDAATRQAVAELEEGFERVDALQRMAHAGEAKALAETLAERASDVAYPPVQAEATFELGQAQVIAGEHERGRDSLVRAVAQAQAAGIDALVRDAASELSNVLGTDLADPTHALPWADLAEATATRIGMTPRQRLTLSRRRAFILAEWGLDREAIEHAQIAVDTAKESFPDDIYLLDGVYSSLGAVYGRLRDFPRAEEAFRRCVELGSQLYGENHPQMLNVYHNLGNALSAQKKTEEAREYLEMAAALAESIPDVAPDERARMANALGNLLLNERKYAEAEVQLQHALRLREQSHGPDHPYLARTLNSLGNVVQHLDRFDEAIAYYERSLKIREKVHGTDHPDLVIVLGNIATLLVRHGEPARSLPYSERVSAILAAHELDPYRQADHRFWYGRALVETGTDPRRGETLVDDAITRLRELGDEGLLRDALAWRTEHP